MLPLSLLPLPILAEETRKETGTAIASRLRCGPDPNAVTISGSKNSILDCLIRRRHARFVAKFASERPV